MLYGLKLVALGAVTLLASLLTVSFGLFDPYGKHVYCIKRLWSWLILTIGGVSIRVNGLDLIDPKRQYIFMVNHQSNLDIPVLIQSLPGFQLRWLTKKELLWIPLFGWALWAAKEIFVDRADRNDALRSLNKAKARMAGGISVVIFPEGTRSSDGRLLPFKRGGFLLAARTQTAIVPVAINGSGNILPKGDWRLRRGVVEVTVSPPVAAADHRSASSRTLSAQVRERIAADLAPIEGEANRQGCAEQAVAEERSSCARGPI